MEEDGRGWRRIEAAVGRGRAGEDSSEEERGGSVFPKKSSFRDGICM